jgi:hypothetical protein
MSLFVLLLATYEAGDDIGVSASNVLIYGLWDIKGRVFVESSDRIFRLYFTLCQSRDR